MLSRRYVSILTILGLTSVVLFQFQNCAPVQPSATASNGGGDARIVDEYNKAEIQFVEESIQVREDVDTAEVNGLCARAHNGSPLNWVLWASSGEVLARGESHCGAGGFNLRLESLNQAVCGVSYQLIIEGDWGGSASANLIQRCQPLASEIVSSANGAPYGTECALEYVPSGESQSPCKQVCYRSQILVSEVPVEAALCSGLAARLAGP